MIHSVMFIEWFSKNDDDGGDQAILRPILLPITTSDLVKYFEDFQVKESSPVYIRFHIITKFNHKEIFYKLPKLA